MSKSEISRGHLVALALAGAWRKAAEPPAISAEHLFAITPLLLAGGVGALVWRRIRNTTLGHSPAGVDLEQAYLFHTINAAMREQELVRSVDFFRSLKTQPILGKGYAIARLYDESGLRPYGDFDFYVEPDQHSLVEKLLSGPELSNCPIDLHRGCKELDDRGYDELFRRSQLVNLGDTVVRVLGAEDHLRLLCLHTLRHGAWRPLWLCDVALAMESCTEGFDWHYFLSGDPKTTDWIVCTLGLAGQLLGARLNDQAGLLKTRELPHWLSATVLDQWGKSFKPQGSRMPMRYFLKHPQGIFPALWERWPNAIEATVDVRGPFNALPRLPFQLADCIYRMGKFFAALKGNATFA